MCSNEPLPIPRIHAGNRQKVDQHAVMAIGENKIGILSKGLILAIVFMAPSFGALASGTLDKQEEALNVIVNFADRICNKISTYRHF